MHSLIVALIACFALMVAGSACAQSFPHRPIRMVVPTAASGTQDTNARAVAKQVAEQTGQQIVIDNRGGANGIIGAQIVANAPPDGYTLLYTGNSFIINQSVVKSLPYNVSRDFIPVTSVAESKGSLLLVHPSIPARSVKELITLSKVRQLSYGSPGFGNTLHLITEMFNVLADISILHVPYKGSGPALAALLGSEIQVLFIPPTVAVQYVKMGRLRALGYGGAKRLEALPEVPIIAEAGLPEFNIPRSWHAMFAPAGTSNVVINKIYAEIRAALDTPGLRDFLLAADFEPVGQPPADFQKSFQGDIRQWGEIARLAKITPQ